MKLAMTLLVRDEADIIGEHLTFHLNAGVDLVLVTDHRSVDGTSDVLDAYARDGSVRVFREEGARAHQSVWMTRMARLAATEHGADWVLNSDADEFWWPRGGTLKDVLALVPTRYGIFHAISRYFVPRPDDGRPFAVRMTARLMSHAPINDPATPFRPVAKVGHRGAATAVLGPGNHSVVGVPFDWLPGWRPIELLHFPLRSAAQCARKYEKTWLAWDENLRGDLARARAFSDDERSESFYQRVVVDDETLERGLADGSLVVDTRLRDALRAIDEGRPVEFGAAAVGDVDYGLDGATVDEADVVRLHRRVDELQRRVDAVELRGSPESAR